MRKKTRLDFSLTTIFLLLTHFKQEEKLRKKKHREKQEQKREGERPNLSDIWQEAATLESLALLEEDCTLEEALLKVGRTWSIFWEHSLYSVYEPAGRV